MSRASLAGGTRAVLTRRRFLLGATAVGGRRRRGRGRRSTVRSRSRGKPIPPVALGRSAAPACPTRQHAWDGDARARLATATRSRRGSIGCCSSTSRATHARRTRACSRRRCATLERRYRVGSVGAAVHRGLGARVFRAALRVAVADPVRDGAVGLRAARDRRLRPLPAPRLRRRAAPRGDRGRAPARRSAARRRRPARRLERAALAETRTGFVGRRAARPQHQDVGGIPPGDPVAKSAPLFMGFKSEPATQPGDRGRRHDPDRPVRRRHDDAGQLHAPAPRQLVPEPQRARTGRAHVRAPGHPRTGQRTSRPTPRATPTCSARRSTATASSDTPRHPPAPARTASR